MRLADKVSIITGAGSGIGHATALKFGREGAKVAVCDINELAAVEVAREVADAGGEALAFRIDVNLKGVYNCTKAVVDIMLEQHSGCILNASSIVGLYGNFGQTNYAASKFAVIGMMKTWARELGKKGIRSNAICPGFIETPILKAMPQKVVQMMEDKVPLGRLGRPEEIANTYAWLASDEASYINGAVIEVSGGSTL